MSFFLQLTEKQKNLLIGLGLFLFTLLLYWPALSNGYVWDDTFLIANNTAFRAGQLHVADLFRPIIPDSGYLRPVALFSFYLEDLLLGLTPFHSHLVNHLLYGLITVLVYGCALRMLVLLDSRWPRPLALLVALLYVTNHAANEAVLWVSGRFDLLATLFILLFVRGYLGGVQERWRVLLLLLCYALAILSKEVALMLLPALALLYLLTLSEPVLKSASVPELLRGFLRTQGRLLAGMLLMTVGYFLLKHTMNSGLHISMEEIHQKWRGVDFFGLKLVVVTFGSFLYTALTSFLTFTPGHYLTPDLLFGISFWSRLVVVMAFLGLLGFGIVRRDQRLIPWGLALLFIFPVLHLISFPWIWYYQDRYTSQFMVFFLLGMVVWLPLLLRSYRILLTLALLLIMAANIIVMPKHISQWENNFTLWRANYLLNQKNDHDHTGYMLTTAAFDSGHYEVFEKVYRRLTPAMQYTLRDVYSMYLIELSKQEGVDRLLQTVQEFEQSREGGKSSRRALGDASDKRDVIYTFLGQGLITISGDFPRALHYARLAVAADPSRPQNYLMLSMAYYANGDLQRGDQYYRAALRSYTSDKASLLAQTRQDYFKKICAFPQSGRNPICQTGR